MEERPGPWRPRAARDVAGRGTARGVFGRLAAAWERSGDRLFGLDLFWSAVLVVTAGVVIGSAQCGPERARFALGQTLAADVVASRDVEVPDPSATEARRREARASIPDLYVHDTERVARRAAELEAELRARDGVGEVSASRVASAFEGALASPVIANKRLLELSPEILVQRIPGGREERVSDYSGILGLDEARRIVRERVLAAGRELPEETAREVAERASIYVDTTLVLDPEGTAARRESEAAGVAPVRTRVRAGTVLARRGERVTEEVLERIEAARLSEGPIPGIGSEGALFVLLLFLAAFLQRYAKFHQRDFTRVRHLHALLALTLVLTVLVARATLWIAGEVSERFVPPFSEEIVYAYLVPTGAGAILVALLANGRIAMVYAIFAAILQGAMLGWDAPVTIWALLVQWTGVYAITSYRERTALLRAGLVVGAAGAVLAVAAEAVRTPPEPPAFALYGAALAFLGGAIGVGLLISFVLPPFERLFRVLTDIRLLELSNVNSPLLSDLALKAPGTYNHSTTVGTLAEEAAKAIGANSLFCRVAAYYHDIGKIQKPQYYVENQRGANPHDRLAPSMSALIIAAHVKDGIRLAREARLPEQIVDIIPQHHGTRLMTYFHEKARRLSDEASGEPNPDDFRYPGPKPRSREAAIFMLADGVEAAARTLDDPTPSRLREVIRKVSNAIVLDGQFEECDLTFADLEKIEEALLRTLTSMYHHRLEYPGFEFGRRRSETRESREGRPAEGRGGRGL